MSAIERLIALDPFAAGSRDELFLEAMTESVRHHLAANAQVAKYFAKRGFAAKDPLAHLDALPSLPAELFKERELLSVPQSEIVRTVQSSSTGGQPSTIHVDRVTTKRQSVISAKVTRHYLGREPRPFIILDTDPTHRQGSSVGARGAATIGYASVASTRHYVLRETNGFPELDADALTTYLKATEDSPNCVLGFTYLVHKLLLLPLLKQGGIRLPPGSKLVHTGGWKSLEAERVSRSQFLDDAQQALGIDADSVFDFYGFTEQMGVVYGSSGLGAKTCPAYSEVVIRNPETLEVVPDGELGLVQALTPIPHSYPGFSVLTGDMGRILGRGRGPDGRYGTQFEVVGRAPKAEDRGCSNVLAEMVSAHRKVS